MTLAGLPPTKALAGTSFVTTALAPIMLPFPILTLGRMHTISPIQTLSSITTGPLLYIGRMLAGILSSDFSALPCELSQINTFRPILTPFPIVMELIHVR